MMKTCGQPLPGTEAVQGSGGIWSLNLSSSLPGSTYPEIGSGWFLHEKRNARSEQTHVSDGRYHRENLAFPQHEQNRQI